MGKLRKTAVRSILNWQAGHGSKASDQGAPPPVPRRLGEPLVSYWRDRVAAHNDDSWAGVPLAKFPEDLRTYQHLMWESRADTVIEVGTKWGGSMLWFRDQLETFKRYGRIPAARVIGIDLITSHAERALDRADPTWREQITLIEGDITDRETVDRIRAAVPPDARCFVVEDSAHTAEATTAALEALSSFVPPEGWFVVEDGIVDLREIHPEPPVISQTGEPTGGVLEAITRWLATPSGSDFTVRPEAELYGITSHPGGFLQRNPA